MRGPTAFLSLLAVSLLLAACESEDEAGPAAFTGVAFEEMVTLDFEEAPTLPSEGGLLARDPLHGAIAFVDRRVPAEIILFSEDGQPAAVFGGEGDGPGEYNRISAVAYDARGRLWVISRMGMQVDILTPDRQVEGSFALDRRVVNLRPLGEAMMLAVTEGAEGSALAYLRADGTMEPLERGPGQGNERRDLVAIATDGAERYWVAQPHGFRVYSGDVRGGWSELNLTEPDWFGETYPEAFQEEFREWVDTGGATIILLEYEAEADLLWITTGVPASDVDAPRFREALESDDPEQIRGIVSMLVDHVVVGVDATTGAVVADDRFDYRAISWTSPLQYEISDDHQTVVVTRPALVR